VSGSADQVRVSTRERVGHAGQIAGIGDQLATAQQAASAVRVDSGAYGKLCQFVPALLNTLHDQMIDGIAAAACSAHDTAEALHSVAADDAGSDDRAADLERAVRWDITEWTGAAADAYRNWVSQQHAAVGGKAQGAETLAAITDAGDYGPAVTFWTESGQP
jgi:hypothetical protein